MKTRPFDERQELHTWLHQTNEQNPTTSKHRLEFTYNYFSLKFVYQTSTVVVGVAVVVHFFNACLCFFLARFLIDRCQIVTDICTKNVETLFGSLLNHLFHYTKIFRWSHSLICIISVCSTYSLKKFFSSWRSLQ